MEKIRAADLVAVVANKTGMTKTAVNKVLHEAAAFITAYAREGRAVNFPSLGKFSPSDRMARTCLSPMGKGVHIPARRVLTFRASTGNRDL